MLTTSKNVDKVYCYLSVNQGPWTRIPPGTNEFVYPTAGEFDLSKYLDSLISPPPPQDVTLELECWGWSGDTLEYLGYLEQIIKKGNIELIAKDFALIASALDLLSPDTGLSGTPSDIAPPYNLEFTRDFDVCFDRYNDVLFDETATTICNWMTNGYTTLIWDWIPGCAYEPCPFNIEDIGGYHIYRDSPGTDPALVSTIVNPKIHIAMIPPGSSGGGNVPLKYFVRAYRGEQESMDSPHISSSTPKYSVVLKNPSLRETMVARERLSWHSADMYDEIDYFPEIEAEVGYWYGPGQDIGGSPIWDFGVGPNRSVVPQSPGTFHAFRD